MSRDVYRRCGCRDENGKQLGTACPRLTSDAKHGTWAYSLSAGTDPRTGRRRQVRKSGFATKREAQNAFADARNKAATGKLPSDTRITVAEYLEKWLQRKAEDGLRHSTLAMYRTYVTNIITPALGRVKLAELSHAQVDRFVRSLSTEKRGATTVRRIHASLSSAMSTAVRLGLITSNPATNIELPKPKKFRANIWEPEAAEVFLSVASEHRFYPLFELAIRTGMRRGEICGLRWDDVSFTNHELAVRVQLVEVSGKVSEGEVKTDSGQDRIIVLDDHLLGVLATWKLTQDAEREDWGDAYEDSGRVFTNEDGTQLRPRNVTRWFKQLTERAGLTEMRFHDLRHLNASLLIHAGVPLSVISKRLGHSTIAITSDLYGHMMRDANRDASDALAGLLAPKNQSVHTLPTQ